MVTLRRPDIRVLDDAFQMHNGYVLSFTNRTMAEFFEDELGIDIYDDRYAANGGSKANRLRTFFEIENAFDFCRVARALWNRREEDFKRASGSSWRTTYPQDAQEAQHNAAQKEALFDLIARIGTGGAVPATDAFYRFTPDNTLEELIRAIDRDIRANKPAAALDRLHTYCQKKFAHLLKRRGIRCDKYEPLHSRFGKYRKALQADNRHSEISDLIMKSSISIFDKFNDTRNNWSLAHDNVLVDEAEARFIYDAVTAILRFVKTIDGERFGE